MLLFINRCNYHNFAQLVSYEIHVVLIRRKCMPMTFLPLRMEYINRAKSAIICTESLKQLLGAENVCLLMLSFVELFQDIFDWSRALNTLTWSRLWLDYSGKMCDRQWRSTKYIKHLLHTNKFIDSVRTSQSTHSHTITSCRKILFAFQKAHTHTHKQFHSFRTSWCCLFFLIVFCSLDYSFQS